MRTLFWLTGMAIIHLFEIGSAWAFERGYEPLTDHVRRANHRLMDVSVALAEGYAPIPCVSGAAGGSTEVHYVNAEYLKDDAINIGRPEALIYEPGPEGKMTLVGVEYITHEGPASLEGHLFNYGNSPNRYGLEPCYELHVWAWRTNPLGSFADMNSNVSCARLPSPKM